MLSPALALVEELAEHLDAGAGGLGGGAETDDLDLLADLDHAAARPRPVTTVPRPVIENTSSIGIRNGWSIVALGLGDEGVDRLHELE